MKPMDYFNLQAKNLFKDYKTQFTHSDGMEDGGIYDYKPRYFDVNGIMLYFDLDEEKFTLMNAQHIIAKLAGFNKWNDMLKATEPELALGKLLFDNQHKISVEEWLMYIIGTQRDNDVIFDPETRLEIFTEVFANVEGHETDYQDFRLDRTATPEIIPSEIERRPKKRKKVQITSLPLSDKDRKAFIKIANSAFERVFEGIEPLNPQVTRERWNPDNYLDEVFFTQIELPIDRDYALSLVDATMLHHVVHLAVEVDEMMEKS